MVEYCAERPPRLLARYGEAVYSGLQLEVRSHVSHLMNGEQYVINTSTGLLFEHEVLQCYMYVLGIRYDNIHTGQYPLRVQPLPLL